MINLAGRVSPEESAAIIAGARLFVGPDSGSLHMASACNVPSLGLYAGTGLRLVPPLATRAIAQQATSSCSRPCGLSPCKFGCNASGFDSRQLCEHMDALLDDEDRAREWIGEQPAQLIAGPRGPHLLQAAALDTDLHPQALQSRPGPGPGLEELPTRARIRPFPVHLSSGDRQQRIARVQAERVTGQALESGFNP
ncbi:MAG: glycosyltransferase family 9 protein, partial [Planctomycetota bacterium]